MNDTLRIKASPSLVVCGAVVLFLVGASGSTPRAFGQAALPSFGNISGVNVFDTEDTGDETNLSLAGDGAGILVVVGETDDPAEGVPGGDVGSDLDIAVVTSGDGGATWSEPQALNSDAAIDSAADVDPKIATDRKGTWVVVWQAVDTGSTTTTDIRWSMSSDNGATWSDAAPLTHTVENVNTIATDGAPSVATDGAGTWIVVWTSSRDIDGDTVPDAPEESLVSVDNDIFFAVSTDNAGSFGSAQALNSDNVEDAASDVHPSIASDGAGNWMVVWEKGGQIVFTRSETNGTVWTPPLAVEGAAGTDPVLLNDGARAATGTTAWYCVWEGGGISVSRYLESDTPEEHEAGLEGDEVFDEWLAPISISGSGTDASIGNDSAGRLIVAWQDGDIVASLSVNVGREWTAPGPVDPEGDATGTDPVAAPVGAESWVILWSSSKDRNGSGTDADLYLAPFTFGVLQDCNGNTIADADDIAAGTSEDCNENGIPDECRDLEADNDGDGTIDACDETPFGDGGGAGGGEGGDGGNDDDNINDNSGGGGSVDGGGSGGGGRSSGGGGGFSFPCAFGIIGGLIPTLFGLTWMKIATGRRRRNPR